MRSHEENVGVFIDAWKLMVGRIPGATIEHSNGVATMFGHIPLPFFNMSLVDRPLRDAAGLRGALAVIRERSRGCHHGSMAAICESWAPDEWEQVIAEEGFALALNTTGMEADCLVPPRRPMPELEYRRVVDEATACDLAMVNGHAYGMPPEMFESICNLNLWQEDSYGYVGYAGGRAVTAAGAFPVAGTLYLALVATLPEAQGNGYAEAVMRRTIEHGQQGLGARRLTLHASDMGQPVYRAMGFEAGAKVVVLVPDDGFEGH